MKLEKSAKRISKRVKLGFKGYPEISIAYFGQNQEVAEEVAVRFIPEEGAEAMEERFISKTDARTDEVIQSAIVKIIERCQAETVTLNETIEIKSK